MKKRLECRDWLGLEKNEIGDDCLTAGKKAVFDFPHTEDLCSYDGIALTLRREGTRELWLEAALVPLPIGRPEFIDRTSARILVPPGETRAEILFSQFDYRRLTGAHLKYISSVEIMVLAGEIGEESGEENGEENGEETVAVENIVLCRSGDFHVTAEVYSLAGEAGERLGYRLWAENEKDSPCYVTVGTEVYGRETVPYEYPDHLVLAPGERRLVEVSAIVPEELAEGGWEEKVLEWIPDGDGSRKVRLSLYTARVLPHPRLLHTEDKWDRLKAVIGQRKELQKLLTETYVSQAEAWQVPEPYSGKEYVYESPSQDPFLKTAIAWKLTGEKRFERKILRYLEGFLDEERGYLATEYSYFCFIESKEEYAKGDFKVRRACSAGWVQEGEFMTKIAVVYDLLYDSSAITAAMHEKMERCMRNYMEFESWRLLDGDGNNFQLSEASAALCFACLLQDYTWVNRFLSGCNGLYELMGSVFSDDGSYFEGASGYMRLAAEILLSTAIVCDHHNLNFKDVLVPASCDRFVLHSPWALRKETAEDKKPFLGMSFERFEKVRKPCRRLKEYFDNLYSLLTPEGILFSVNDSNEQSLTPVMEIAYYVYRDPKYLSVIDPASPRELLYGIHMAEEPAEQENASRLVKGNGFAVLRERQASYTQAVLKFGQHGGYHGHYDRLSLLSVIKDNRTFHNQEFTWYGYDSFLFKMWVQTSLAHNMVVVDHRMQEPAPCECIYYESGDTYQAVCAQTTCRWSDPPYGGQTPYLYRFPEEKCAAEGRYILPGKRRQGEIGEYSEPVFQRRLLILVDGICILWDYAEGEEEHEYDCLYHPLGSMKTEGLEFYQHTARFDSDPYGAGQFIMNCHWYHGNGVVKMTFENDGKMVNPNDIIEYTKHTALYRAYPASGDVLAGRYPQRSDTFEREEEYQMPDFEADTCKKTIGFCQRGKKAGFITLLETGNGPELIKSVIACSYEKIRIEETSGKVLEIEVKGMDEKERKKIEVHVNSAAGRNIGDDQDK